MASGADDAVVRGAPAGDAGWGLAVWSGFFVAAIKASGITPVVLLAVAGALFVEFCRRLLRLGIYLNVSRVRVRDLCRPR